MPYGAHINPESLGRLVLQIGVQLRHITPPEFLNSGPIELRESFELWALGLDALARGAHSQRQIRQLARPVGRWHHQIAFGGRSEAFARSSVSAEGIHQLEELFVSPIAQSIDRAITWLDENATPGEHARLLVVPSAHLLAFWLEIGDAPTRLLLIGNQSPPSEHFELHDSAAFLRHLGSTVEPAGVLLGGQRVLSV